MTSVLIIMSQQYLFRFIISTALPWIIILKILSDLLSEVACPMVSYKLVEVGDFIV